MFYVLCFMFYVWGLPCQTGIGGIHCEGDGGWVKKGQEGEVGKREGGVKWLVDAADAAAAAAVAAAAADAAAAERLLPNLSITNKPPPPSPNHYNKILNRSPAQNL